MILNDSVWSSFTFRAHLFLSLAQHEAATSAPWTALLLAGSVHLLWRYINKDEIQTTATGGLLIEASCSLGGAESWKLPEQPLGGCDHWYTCSS